MILALGLQTLLGRWVPPPISALTVAAVNALALGTVLVLGYGRRWPPAGRWVALGPRFAVGLALTAFGGSVVLAELGNALTLIWSVPPAVARLFEDLMGGPWVETLVAVALVAPVTEELLFRGLVLSAWGTWPSALAFGAFHLNLWQGVPAVLAGWYLARLTQRTGGLAAAILAHALYNALGPTLSAVGVRIPQYNTPLVEGVAGGQPLAWLVVGALALGLGLAWTLDRPLSAPGDSGKVPL